MGLNYQFKLLLFENIITNKLKPIMSYLILVDQRELKQYDDQESLQDPKHEVLLSNHHLKSLKLFKIFNSLLTDIPFGLRYSKHEPRIMFLSRSVHRKIPTNVRPSVIRTFMFRFNQLSSRFLNDVSDCSS